MTTRSGLARPRLKRPTGQSPGPRPHSDPDLALPGFGHPVFKDCDPRAACSETHCAELAEGCGHAAMEEIADAVGAGVEVRTQPANLDWSVRPADALCRNSAGRDSRGLRPGPDGRLVRARHRAGRDGPRHSPSPLRYRGVEARPYIPLRESVTRQGRGQAGAGNGVR